MTRLERILEELQADGYHIVNTTEETTIIGLTMDMARDDEFGNRNWTATEQAIGLTTIDDGEELVWIASTGANRNLMTLLNAIDRTEKVTETDIKIDEYGNAYGVEFFAEPKTDYGLLLVDIYMEASPKVDYGIGEKKPYREGIELLLA